KKYKKAKIYNDQSLSFYKEWNGAVEGYSQILSDAVKIDSAVGNFKDAFINYQLYISTENKKENDKISNAVVAEKFREQFRQRKFQEKIGQEKKDNIAKLELRSQKLISY